jgi:hypothetical protein
MKNQPFGLPLGILLCAISGFAAADGSPFSLDVTATSGESDVQLSVPSNGLVDFSIIQPKVSEPSATIDLSVSQFSGDQGDAVTANLIVPGVPEAKPEQRGINFAKPVMHLQLSVPKLPTAGKYRGSLILTANGKDLKVWRLVLSRAVISQSSTLVLDQHATTLEIARPFWGWCKDEGPQCSVRIWEKSGQWALDGVTTRVDQVAKAPGRGFDLERNVAIRFTGMTAHPAPDSTGTAGGSPNWTVEAEQTATATLTFLNLEAGEYNIRALRTQNVVPSE